MQTVCEYRVYEPSVVGVPDRDVDRATQLGIGPRHRELRESACDGLGGTEQDAAVRLAQHRGVVVAVARGDNPELEFPQPSDGCPLLVGHAQAIVDEHSAGIDFERMAKSVGIPSCRISGWANS